MKKKTGRQDSPCVLWAVDPEERMAKPSAAALQNLARWARDANLALLPIHVMPFRNVEPGIFDDAATARRSLEQYVDDFNLPDALVPQVIFSEGSSRESMVLRLLGFAKERNADMIALSTHGRSGLGRLVFGSFAENLLKDAPTPVLFLGREASEKPESEAPATALFATDFSTYSHSAFVNFLLWAKKLGMRVILYHFAGFPVPAAGAELPAGTLPESYFQEQEKYAKRESRLWIKQAQQQGVVVELFLRKGGIGMVTAELIQDAAAEAGARLIVMASRSKALDRFLLGSAAYEALRKSKLPVLLYGPKALVKAARVRGAVFKRIPPHRAVGSQKRARH